MALPEDDPELKDLVTQTLEQNGLLKKIKVTEIEMSSCGKRETTT